MLVLGISSPRQLPVGYLRTETEHGHIPTVLGHRRIYLQATFISTQAQRHALHTVHRKAIHLPHNDGHTRSPIEHDAAQISTRHLPVAVPTPALHNAHNCRPPMIHIYPSASARHLRMAIPRLVHIDLPNTRCRGLRRGRMLSQFNKVAVSVLEVEGSAKLSDRLWLRKVVDHTHTPQWFLRLSDPI